MDLHEIVRRLWKNPVDGWYFLQGTIRYWVFQHYPAWIRPHIRQQYEWRKEQAQACYRQGECRCCGCETPSLFFAAKACAIANKKHYPHCGRLGDPCYPRLMNRRNWKVYKATMKH